MADEILTEEEIERMRLGPRQFMHPAYDQAKLAIKLRDELDDALRKVAELEQRLAGLEEERDVALRVVALRQTELDRISQAFDAAHRREMELEQRLAALSDPNPPSDEKLGDVYNGLGCDEDGQAYEGAFQLCEVYDFGYARGCVSLEPELARLRKIEAKQIRTLLTDSTEPPKPEEA